jgi:hypothetical protein
MRVTLKLLLALVLFGALVDRAAAWENHAVITRLALEGWDNWENAPFEPLEKVLPALHVGGQRFADREGFFKVLEIRGDKVPWDERSPGPVAAEHPSLALVAWASDHPDLGMDQELNLHPDQEFMGGYTGLSSQAIRHMYYPEFIWKKPLTTFHYPHPSEPMGFAPERAQLFFDLAIQAKNKGHWHWAYRFLGMSLHYIQDLNQPYHSSQFGSVVLLPYKVMIQGKDPFIREATRVISNFHLEFEMHTDFYLHKALSSSNPDPIYKKVVDGFKVPQGCAKMKKHLESNLEKSIREGAVRMAKTGQALAPSVVREQLSLMEKELYDNKTLDLGSGFFEENGKPKLDLEFYERHPSTGIRKKREQLAGVMNEALSNTGVSTRWVFDKFRLLGR